MKKVLFFIFISISAYSQPTPVPEQSNKASLDGKLIMEKCVATLNAQMTNKEKVKALDDCMVKSGLIRADKPKK
jgi:hypothetical protein